MEFPAAWPAAFSSWACLAPGMSEYSSVRGGQLKLKGKAGSQFKKKKSKRKRDSLSEHTAAEGDLKHG